MKYILCGNPNVGKTTFLNSLTGANEHVGNWHGVTVDFFEKKFALNGKENVIVDLPGLYSLSAYSFEEEVARNYVYFHDENIINLIDSNNLSRNLYLTLSLLEAGKNIKVCLNFANELKKNNVKINTKMLAKMLKTEVVLFDAQKKDETKKILDDDFKNKFECPYYKFLPIKEVYNIVKDNLINLEKMSNKKFENINKNNDEKDAKINEKSIKNNIILSKKNNENYENLTENCAKNGKKINEKSLKNIENKTNINKENYHKNNYANNEKKFYDKNDKILTKNNTENEEKIVEFENKNDGNLIEKGYKNDENLKKILDLPVEFLCVKILEEDEFIMTSLKLSIKQKEKLKKFDLKDKIVELRYNFIDEIIKNCVEKQSNKIYGYGVLDKIFLNKFLALPIFAILMMLIFYLTFSLIGPICSEILSKVINICINVPIMNMLSKITNSAFVLSFFENGVLTVLSTLSSFLPQIVLLFLFISILEDTGYLSRLAFMFEDVFSLVGLSGRSVFTLLMGFGCSTTAALTSKTMDDKNSKIKTTILCGYISCTAKIPLYSVILGAFFNNNVLIIFFLYLLGVIVSLFVSSVLEKTILKSKKASFIMEMPAYRFPSFKRIMKLIWFNVVDFLKRVTGVLFAFSIIIWLLQNLSINFTFISNQENATSILAFIGNFLAPIFAPLGFGTGGCVSALICGVVAKEVIVSTMAIINGVDISLGVDGLSKSFLDPINPIHFSPISAFSYLIFSLLYLPCIATISVYFKEIGKKWTFVALIIQFVVAYVVTFVFYRLLLLFNGLNFISIFLSLLILLLVVLSVKFVIKLIKKPKICCFACKNCRNKNCGK